MYKIYKLTSPSSKCYIGLTSQKPEKRLTQHIRRWKKGYKTKLTDAFSKYSPELWTQSILATAPTAKVARLLEILFIKYYNSIESGYNLTIGGDGVRPGMYRMPEEAKRKISIANKGRENKFKGIPRTQEVKNKLSKANKGRKFPGRSSSSTWVKGATPWNKNIPYTEERKTKHRICLGKRCTDGINNYTSVTDLAEQYNVSRATMLYRIKSSSKKFNTFCFIAS